MTEPIATEGQLRRMLTMVPPFPSSHAGEGLCVAVVANDQGLWYRGCAPSWDDARPWTDRWARLTVRDSVFCKRPTCFEVELSDGTRFGGEMSTGFADRRCMEWVGWGRR